MPRKRKEDYNAYMRDYMYARHHKLNEKKQSDLNKIASDVFGNDDKILHYIKIAEKYTPVIMQFVKGFADNFKANQAVQGTNAKSNAPIPPVGWLEMSPLKRLSFKISRADWYNAGCKYEELISSSGAVTPYYDTAPVQRAEQSHEPKNLSQLSNKYPEAPLVKEEPVSEAKDEIKEEAKKEPDNANKEAKPIKSDMEQVQEALMKDNEKYLMLAVNAIKQIEPNELKSKLNNPEELVKQFTMYKDWIPIQVKTMILQGNSKMFVDLFRDNCPEHYKEVKSNEYLTKLNDLFELIKKELI